MNNETLNLSSQEIGKRFARLYDIITILRGPKGCPWDRKQTLSSLHVYLVEEVYELLDGIRHKNLDNIQEEIGDVYLVNTMIGHVLEIDHQKNMASILDGVCEKLIRRHTHVFGKEKASTEQEGRSRWLKAKKEESEKKLKNTDLLHSCGRSLPPLEKTMKIQKMMPVHGLEQYYDENLVLDTLKELGQINETIAKEKLPEITHKFGNMLFTIMFLAHNLGINPCEALENSNSKIIEKIAISQQSE